MEAIGMNTHSYFIEKHVHYVWHVAADIPLYRYMYTCSSTSCTRTVYVMIVTLLLLPHPNSTSLPQKLTVEIETTCWGELVSYYRAPLGGRFSEEKCDLWGTLFDHLLMSSV